MQQTVKDMIASTTGEEQTHWQVLQLMIQKRQWALCLDYASTVINEEFLPPMLRSIGEQLQREDNLEEAIIEVSPIVPEVPVIGFIPESIAVVERKHIIATLEFYRWNKSLSSKTLGIERSTLDRKLKAYGVKRP